MSYLGPIPVGFRYLVQSTSESTHQIPAEGGPDAVRDYRKLLGAVEQFVRGESASFPPVFAKVLTSNQPHCIVVAVVVCVLVIKVCVLRVRLWAELCDS